jgi:hypothetical protein
MSMSSDEAANGNKSTKRDARASHHEQWSADMADPSMRRDVLLGQIARVRGTLYAAKKAGDLGRAAELKRIADALVAARDALG